MKQIALINPKSGFGKTGCNLPTILNIIKTITQDYYISQYSGHWREIAKYNHNYDNIIAVGGDGKIREILDGMNKKDQTLLIIPSGKGNALAHDLGIKDFHSSVKTMKEGKTRNIDVIKIKVRNTEGIIKEYHSLSVISWLCSKVCRWSK